MTDSSLLHPRASGWGEYVRVPLNNTHSIVQNLSDRCLNLTDFMFHSFNEGEGRIQSEHAKSQTQILLEIASVWLAPVLKCELPEQEKPARDAKNTIANMWLFFFSSIYSDISMDPTDSDLGKQTTCLSLPVANCDGSTVTFLSQNSHKNQFLDKVKARVGISCSRSMFCFHLWRISAINESNALTN